MHGNNKVYPPVVIVDEHDKEVGTAKLVDAWQQGLYHRVVSVVVIDDQGRMLLQLRGPDVKVYPNHWDQAAGGHVDEGYSYKQAAVQELSEEIGLADVELTEVATFRNNLADGDRIVNQFERVYAATVPHDAVLRPQLDEVSELRWFTAGQLQSLISNQPDKITPGLRYILELHYPRFVSKIAVNG